jgi:hypothetical protein
VVLSAGAVAALVAVTTSGYAYTPRPVRTYAQATGGGPMVLRNRGSSYYGPSGDRSQAVKNEGAAVTNAYRETLGTLSTGFVDDLDQLQAALAAGNLVAARSAELAAQEQYDGFRFVIGQGGAAATLDGLADDVPAGRSFAGLHLIERDLWGTGAAAAGQAAPGADLAGAAGALSALLSKAALLELSLSDHPLTPEEILTNAVRTLGWVNEYAVPGREEAYSHLDAADVAGAFDAVQSAFDDVEPLGMEVSPLKTVAMSNQLSVLQQQVLALGTPGTVPDGSIAPSTWTTLAQQVDVTAAALSQLAPTFAGYGPRQLYGYNS